MFASDSVPSVGLLAWPGQVTCELFWGGESFIGTNTLLSVLRGASFVFSGIAVLVVAGVSCVLCVGGSSAFTGPVWVHELLLGGCVISEAFVFVFS